MVTITFRPLRRLKSGKIAIASYMQWRKVKNLDWTKFELIIDTEYKTMPPDAYVYNHKEENLFWIDYNPEEIPLLSGLELKDGEQYYPKRWKTTYNMYASTGLDCDGVPAFSNYTLDQASNRNSDYKEFEPLTVSVVNKWFGWYDRNHMVPVDIFF